MLGYVKHFEGDPPNFHMNLTNSVQGCVLPGWDAVILTWRRKNIDDQASFRSGSSAVDGVRRGDIDIASAHLARFAVDRHQNRAFDHGAALLVRMMVERNFGSWLDAHEIDHHVGSGRRPHGDSADRFQAGHGVDIAPDNGSGGIIVWHIDILDVGPASAGTDCR